MTRRWNSKLDLSSAIPFLVVVAEVKTVKKRNVIFALIGVGGLTAAYLSGGFSSSADAVSQNVETVQGAAAESMGNARLVATLGSVSIDADTVGNWLASMPTEVRDALRSNRAPLEQWLRSQLAERALFAEATAQEWQQRPEVARAIEQATREIVLRSYMNSVSQPPEDFPSEVDMTAAYEQSKNQLVIPARYRLRQIYLAAPANDESAIEAARTRATELVKQAKTKNADFSVLAREHSNDARSAALGGDIGLQPLPQLLPEVRPVVSGMKVGDVSDPVQTATGLHILKLEEVQEARHARLNEVDENLRQALRQQRQTQTAQAYMEGLLTSSALSIDGAQITELLEQPLE